MSSVLQSPQSCLRGPSQPASQSVRGRARPKTVGARLSPGSARWTSLPQAPYSCRSRRQDGWSSWSRERVFPASQWGPGRGAAERCVGPQKGVLSDPSRLCDIPSPPAPQGAVCPWRRAWPRGSGEGTDTGWEPPVCGDPPLRPPAALRPQRPRHHFTDEGTGVHRCWVTGSGSHGCQGQEGPEAKVPSLSRVASDLG